MESISAYPSDIVVDENGYLATLSSDRIAKNKTIRGQLPIGLRLDGLLDDLDRLIAIFPGDTSCSSVVSDPERYQQISTSLREQGVEIDGTDIKRIFETRATVYSCSYLHTVCMGGQDVTQAWTDETKTKFMELMRLTDFDEFADLMSTSEAFLDVLLDRLTVQPN